MRKAGFTNHQRVTPTARRVEATPVAAVPAGFIELSTRVLVALAFEFDGVIPHRELRALVREAEAIALETSSPLLMLPGLAEERVRAAVLWHRRQQQILDRSEMTLAE